MEPYLDITDKKMMRVIDGVSLTKVLENLICNALKYSKDKFIYIKLNERGIIEI